MECFGKVILAIGCGPNVIRFRLMLERVIFQSPEYSIAGTLICGRKGFAAMRKPSRCLDKLILPQEERNQRDILPDTVVKASDYIAGALEIH